MRKIIITLYVCEHDCDCCGFNSNHCVNIDNLGLFCDKNNRLGQ